MASMPARAVCRTQTPICAVTLAAGIGQALQGRAPLVAKAVVHALAPICIARPGRWSSGGKALRPEDGHCPLQHFVAIEFSWLTMDGTLTRYGLMCQ